MQTETVFKIAFGIWAVLFLIPIGYANHKAKRELLIPIILNRVKLEDKLLTEEFQDAYQKYKEETTKKLIPFIY